MDYKPLQADRKEFRLLRLRSRCYQPPTSQTDLQLKDINVVCELEHAFQGHCEPYNALSYAWGDMNDSQPVTVDGTALNVSTSLESGLRELRDEQTDLLLWVDQICL
jgi:hypothetical protein